MKLPNRKVVYAIAGLVISLSLVLALLKFVDIRQVWDNIRQMTLQTMCLLVFVYLVNISVRTSRWKYLICQEYQVAFPVTFKALVYGFMLNQLLPAKIGELARIEYITRKRGYSRGYLLGSIAVERVFDLVIIALFLGVSVLFSNIITKHVKSNIVPVVLMIIGLMAIFMALFYLAEVKRITKYFPSKIQQTINRLIDSLIRSTQLFHSLRQVSRLFLISLTIWSMTCVTIFVILQSFGVKLPFYAYFFVVSAGTFGMIIPSTSANVGVYHAVAMGSLMLFGISKEKALSYAIVAHAFDFFPAVILGGLLFGYSGIKHYLKRLRTR